MAAANSPTPNPGASGAPCPARPPRPVTAAAAARSSSPSLSRVAKAAAMATARSSSPTQPRRAAGATSPAPSRAVKTARPPTAGGSSPGQTRKVKATAAGKTVPTSSGEAREPSKPTPPSEASERPSAATSTAQGEAGVSGMAASAPAPGAASAGSSPILSRSHKMATSAPPPPSTGAAPTPGHARSKSAPGTAPASVVAGARGGGGGGAEALVPQLREEAAALRAALEGERRAVRELRRALKKELRAVREEEARRREDCLADLRARLQHEHEAALAAQRESLARGSTAELARALADREAALRLERIATQRQLAHMQQQLREARRPDHDCRHLQAEATRLKEANRQLSDRVQNLSRELQEKRAAARASKGTAGARGGGGGGGAVGPGAEALVPQLREEAAALRAALEGERRAVRELRRALKKELRAVREEEARRREDCLADLRARLQHEHEAALAAQREVLARGSAAELARALADREAALRLERAATQRQLQQLQQQLRDAHRGDHDCRQLQAEAARLRDANRQLSDRVQELEYSLTTGELTILGPCLEDLRLQLEEREKEIANLRQAALEKERQFEQLSIKCQNQENIEQFCKLGSLDPVAEVNEEVREARASPTPSEEPSTPTTPLVGEIPADTSLYSGLLRDHVELRRAHHAVELRLRVSESRARSAAQRLQQLQAEARELRELNELQEFRILELEESHDRWRTPRSPGSHDTRDVCTDTENDDVSDSGVLSLPTSEDVASDSDAGTHDLKGDGTKSHSEYAPIHSLLPKMSSRSVAPFPPLVDMPHSSLTDGDDSLARHLKSAECLQESGIFEGDSVSDYCSRGTQTESDLLPSHAELKAEIRKLKQYRECIKKDENKDELAACRDQLRKLEDKVHIYESSGDTQVQMLAERLQKEISLASQIEQLEHKITRLQADNMRLEEQRCELEEAENDTRLRCQKMESKLQTLIDKKLELHLRLKEERRATACLKNKHAEGEKWRKEATFLKSMLSKYEQRNNELEGREADLRQRLHLLHTCWPAVLLWQVWNALCSSCAPPCMQQLPSSSAKSENWMVVPPKHLHTSDIRTIETEMSSRMPLLSPSPSPKDLSPEPMCSKHLLPDNDDGNFMGSNDNFVIPIIRRDAYLSVERGIQTDDTLSYTELKQAKEMEEKLMQTIKELREEISLMKDFPKELPSEVVTTGEGEGHFFALEGQEEDYIKKLHQLTQGEMDMLSRITELERKETAYMQTLQQADELWSELESGYQRQVQSLRATEAELRARLEAAESQQRQRHRAEHDVNELEQAVSELTVTLRRAEEERATLAAKVAQLSEALAVADSAVERLTHEVERELRPRLSQERRLTAELQRELAHRGHAYENMQDSYEAEVEKLKCQLAAARKECIAVNNECYHLKAEVQELKVGLQNTIQELRTCMAKQKSDDEKTLVHLTNLLAEKDRELQGIVQASQDVMMRSAHDEIEEAEAEAAQAQPLDLGVEALMRTSDSASRLAEAAGPSGQDDSGIGMPEEGPSHVAHINDAPAAHSKGVFQV